MATTTNASLPEYSGLSGAIGSKTAFTYLAVGSGTTTESAAHTALVTEITDSGLARVASTVTQETTTQTNDTLQLATTWNITGTKTIAEVGTFNASSGGTMGFRELLSSSWDAIDGDTYRLTCQVVFA